MAVKYPGGRGARGDTTPPPKCVSASCVVLPAGKRRGQGDKAQGRGSNRTPAKRLSPPPTFLQPVCTARNCLPTAFPTAGIHLYNRSLNPLLEPLPLKRVPGAPRHLSGSLRGRGRGGSSSSAPCPVPSQAEAEAPQQEEGKTRYVFRDGKMVEITGEGRQRDKAKVDAIWSSDIMRRHQSLIRRQQRLGMF